VARVLYLTQVLPYPLSTGARTRQYYVLRHLSQYHEVTLLSFVRDDDKQEHIAHLQSVCHAVYTAPIERSRWRDLRAVAKGLLTGQPMVIVRDEFKSMQNLLAWLMTETQFDVVHADQVSMSWYGLMGRGPRRVLDLHNAMYLVTERLAHNDPSALKRLALRREAKALARYEAELCAKYDQVTFVTHEDRRLIEQQVKAQQVAVPPVDRFTTIPICIDPTDKPVIQSVPHPHRIVALGVMYWPPNAEGALWFAREIWPHLRTQYPEAIFTIIGKNPPDELKQLHGRDNIEVLGFVSDLEQTLTETAVFVVPLRAGGGMRVKILDTWCWGLPIVSTTIGAEGLEIRDGENILIADEPAALVQAVSRAYQDHDLSQRLRLNGRRWVEDNYDWRQVYTAWDAVYAKALKA
jgi:polysaccharide biosynthesis protein PslH